MGREDAEYECVRMLLQAHRSVPLVCANKTKLKREKTCSYHMC